MSSLHSWKIVALQKPLNVFFLQNHKFWVVTLLSQMRDIYHTDSFLYGLEWHRVLVSDLTESAEKMFWRAPRPQRPRPPRPSLPPLHVPRKVPLTHQGTCIYYPLQLRILYLRPYVASVQSPYVRPWQVCSRLQLKCDGTRWHTCGEMKGKLANAVGSQYPSHYLGTWCIQHYYRWCAHLGCRQSNELTPTGRFKWTGECSG